ncbi:MAG: polyprenyl synthetase family protein [Pirellulales bacterium]
MTPPAASTARQTRDPSVPPDARAALAALYAPIRQPLAAVDDRLKTELQSRYPFVDELVKHAFRLGGKRLRPALLLLSAQAVGSVTDEHITLGAVVEMIHTATLVHDDVLDEAQLRRHVDTVNARWDNEASVLLGDYLFSHAFYLASTTGSTRACRIIGRATNVTCEGELRQVRAGGDLQLAEQEYLGIIAAKTAELCACSCQLGALYAGASETVADALAAYGRNLGIAFQIADDLLDLVGEENAVGKSLGTDLEKRKATLPVIHLLAAAADDDREAITAVLTRPDNHRVADLLPWLDRYRSLDYARRKAEHYANEAIARLALLDESPEREVLTQMARFVVSRDR